MLKKLVLFLAVGGFFWIYGFPKRAQFLSGILGRNKAERLEESMRAQVQDKVRRQICRLEDLCEYRSLAFSDFHIADSVSASLIHEFSADGKPRQFLFRFRR